MSRMRDLERKCVLGSSKLTCLYLGYRPNWPYSSWSRSNLYIVIKKTESGGKAYNHRQKSWDKSAFVVRFFAH